MAWEIEESSEFDGWFDGLDESDQIQVIAAWEYLADTGPAARFPMSYPIKQPNNCGMRELRPGSSGRSEIRILYAFDSRRVGLLLLAGDKAQLPNDWDDWYSRSVPLADEIFSREEASRRGRESHASPKKSESSKKQLNKRKGKKR